jgi:hypothetical protein
VPSNLKMSSIKTSHTKLYEQDYYGWITEQVRALREHRIEDIDFENIAEEVEGLGKSERRSIESQLETLIEHLLKLTYARGMSWEYNARAWENTVELARFRLQRLLDESPSLRPALPELFNNAYRGARISARRALGFPREPLPEVSPLTLEQALDDSFLPTPAK